MPARLQWTALIALAAGYAFCLWAMRVNRFFSSIVRIQNDRGQVVITTGPYAIIRHPGYLAGIVIVVASGPALDSWIAAAVLVVSALPFLLYRAATEDRVLLAELPGYRATTRSGCAGGCCREFGEGRRSPARRLHPASQSPIRIRHIMEYLAAPRCLGGSCA